MSRRKVILFELNEVPFRVYRYYADRNPRSAIARLIEHGRSWTTVAADEGHLSPWITWPTLHRGVDNRKHQISVLGQDVREADALYPPIWSLLTQGGRKVGMFGSLHTYPLPPNLDNFSFYMPDTFAAGPEAHPAELSAFQSFNLKMVDGSGRNVSTGLPIGDAMQFLGSAWRLGLRTSTIRKIMRQIASERIKPDRAVRRRTMQSLLSFDFFVHQLSDKKPDAAFYFTNHVASSMHRYWPATFTDDYVSTSWPKDWVARFSGEIDYAMAEADAMLADLIAFVDRNPEYLLLASGSMGQAAVDSTDTQVSAQVMLGDKEKFVRTLGVKGEWTRRRTMEPCYTFVFDYPTDAETFAEALKRLSVGGEPVSSARLDDHSVEFTLGQNNLSGDRATALLGNETFDLESIGMANIRIQDEVGSAAYHIPEGVLFAYDPQRDGKGYSDPEPVSTLRVAPTLLALLEVDRPAYMEAPIETLAAR